MLTALMNICGFIAARVHDPVHIIVSYASGCGLFLFLCGTLTRFYIVTKSLYNRDVKNAAYLTYVTYLTYSITLARWLYPLIFALYGCGVVGIEAALLAFITLDGANKRYVHSVRHSLS